MSTLVEAIAAHLQGEKGLSDLISDLQQGRKELQAHQEDISHMLAKTPDFLIGVERDEWLASFTVLDERLAKAEKEIQNQDLIKALATEVPDLMEQLMANALTLREAAWAARGPSSHGGANELLFFLERYSEEPSDELFDILHAKLEVEFTRFEHQAQAYVNLPEFCAVAMEELLPEYRDILERVAQIPELGDEEVDELFEQLENWANNFTVYDLDFLVKRYSDVPTQIPCVNFALNCQMLYFDELVTDEMVDYAIDVAIETLQVGSESFLEEQSLPPVAHHNFQDALETLLKELENLADVAEKEELREVGAELRKLTEDFVEAQNQAESESGSRLDFKSE